MPTFLQIDLLDTRSHFLSEKVLFCFYHSVTVINCTIDKILERGLSYLLVQIQMNKGYTKYLLLEELSPAQTWVYHFVTKFLNSCLVIWTSISLVFFTELFLRFCHLYLITYAMVGTCNAVNFFVLLSK